MSGYLRYDEIKVDTNVKLEDILHTLDDSDICYFVEVDLSYPDEIKEKTKNFTFASENKKLILMISVIIGKRFYLTLIHKLKN